MENRSTEIVEINPDKYFNNKWKQNERQFLKITEKN